MTSPTIDTNPRPAHARITAFHVAVLAACGAVLWLLAAVLLRAIGPLGAFRGLAVPLLYALVFAGTALLILIGRKLARLPGDRTLLGVSIMTATAALLDGVALAWRPSLYGTEVVGAAAALLWGVGVALALGLVMNRPPGRRRPS